MSGFRVKAGTMALRVARAVLLRLEALAVLAGVGLAAWAAADVSPSLGKAVLAGGLLFLGGAIARLSREVRGG